MTSSADLRPDVPHMPPEEAPGRSSLEQSLSDSERPVREKLKQTSIAGLPEGTASGDNDDSGFNESSDEGRGRPKKKRSLEELDDTEDPSESRKRSREVSTVAATSKKAAGEDPVEGIEENGVLEVPGPISGEKTSTTARPLTPDSKETEIDMDNDHKSGLRSPKNKRDRATYLRDDAHEVEETKTTGNGKVEEPSAKRTKDGEKAGESSEDEGGKSDGPESSTTKIPPASGFSNKSATSPFGALSGEKSASGTAPSGPQWQTSAAAFQASGFGKLASTSSPFGSLGASSSASPFGGLSGSKPSSGFGSSASTATPSSTTSTFGGASAKPLTSFASASVASSGFGNLGNSGFGGLGGSKLSGFASSAATLPPITGLSNKPVRPFGTPADEDEEGEAGSGAEEDAADDGGESRVKSPEPTDPGRDKRFYEQHIDTGEEGEQTIFSARAKLYNFVTVGEKKEWKERGLGTFKVNVTKSGDDVSEAEFPGKEDEEEDKTKKQARFVMRAEGSHRVILNSRISKELKVGDPHGDKPKASYFFFLGSMDGGGLELLQIKMRHPLPQDLYARVKELQEEM